MSVCLVVSLSQSVYVCLSVLLVCLSLCMSVFLLVISLSQSVYVCLSVCLVVSLSQSVYVCLSSGC